MKKIIYIVFALICSVILQKYSSLNIDSNFLGVVITTFSIFFGFYMTSFGVFATSRYLSKLYKVPDPKDNSKTRLDNLIEEFSFATKFLLISLLYSIILYVFITNGMEKLSSYLLFMFWGVIGLNIYFAFESISIFIVITRQSAKE